MEKKKQAFSLLAVLAILVLVFSFINLGERSTAYNALSAVVSVLGITGGITYFLKKTYAANILYAWLLLQVIIVEPYYSVNQFPTMNLMGNVGGLRLGINPLPLLIFLVVKFWVKRTENKA